MLESSNKLICVGNITPSENEKIHQRNFVYWWGGILPSETATQYKDPIRVLVEVDDEE